MNSPAEIIRAALVVLAAGTRPGAATPPTPPVWPIYVGHMPNDPDNAVCIHDTAGRPDGRIMRGGETIQKPGWMVHVRGLDHPTAYARIDLIRRTMDGIRNFVVAVDGNRYSIESITQLGGILSLGQEPEVTCRDGFTLNGTVTYREVPR